MMRGLDLDLLKRRPAWPCWVVLAIGAALVADAGLQRERLGERLDELQRPPVAARAAKRTEGVSPETQRELDGARRLLQELVLPWETLLRGIEASADKDSGLLAIEPDADKRAVRITGEARDYGAVLDFVTRLSQKPGLAHIHLLNHQMREDVAERPFMFTLSASWGGAK
jgi:hypothetical protein